MDSKLRIGLSAKFHDRSPVYNGKSKRHIQYLETPVARWIAKNQALPFMIPSESIDSDLTRKTLDVRGYAREMDGLILQGGVDVHPSFYDGYEIPNNPHRYDIVRDHYELALVKAFLDERKPIIGICRGLQLLNVYFGGTLHTDLEEAGLGRHLDEEIEDKYFHDVKVLPGGIFSSIYPEIGQVTSLHHQGIKDLGSGLRAEAVSQPHDLIEAISLCNAEQFVLAVQWHPEFHDKGHKEILDGDQIFQVFLRTARNRRYFGDLSMHRKKPVKFSKSSSLTLGCELELQVVNSATYDLEPAVPRILEKTQPRTSKIKSEIFQSMVEVETEICTDVHEIEIDLKSSQKILLKAADSVGVRVGSAGTHPFAIDSDRILTPSMRYEALMESKQWIARRIAIFGLHAHVGVSDPQQGIQLYRFYLSVAPLLLAISSSSPFLRSQVTGLHSVRSTFFESTPTGGHPPILESWAEFEGLMSKLLKSKAIGSHKDLWWDVRPSLSYGTIEVRICDTMTTVHENAALVSFIHLLGYAFLNSKDYKEWPVLSDWSYRENKWRALRYGLDFDFIFNEQGASRPARDYGLTLLDDLQGFVEELGYKDYVDTLRSILKGQTAADKMMSVYSETRDFKSVVKWYCDQLSAE